MSAALAALHWLVAAVAWAVALAGDILFWSVLGSQRMHNVVALGAIPMNGNNRVAGPEGTTTHKTAIDFGTVSAAAVSFRAVFRFE